MVSLKIIGNDCNRVVSHGMVTQVAVLFGRWSSFNLLETVGDS